MLSCNPRVQLELAKEPALLATLHDLFRGFHVSEAALLSGLLLLQCLASGPACCKHGITLCTAWSRPDALLAALVALLKHPTSAVVDTAAKCLRMLSSDKEQQVVCCRVLLQQHKHKSAATLLAGILKTATAAQGSAAAVSRKTLRAIPDLLGSMPARPVIDASTGSSSSNKDLLTHSMPIAAVSKKGSALCHAPPEAVQAAATLCNLAEAVPANLMSQKGVASALLLGLSSSSPELLLPCLRAVLALTASPSAAAMLARCKGAKAAPLLAALTRSQDTEVSSCAALALTALNKHHLKAAADSPWMSKLCQQPKVQEA